MKIASDEDMNRLLLFKAIEIFIIISSFEKYKLNEVK